jgi:hypothetical protein
MGVAEALDLYRPKDSGDGAGAAAAVGVTLGDAIGTRDGQGRAGIAVAALVQVRLQQQALHLAAARVLFGFDRVEGQLGSGLGGEPGFQQGELGHGGRGGGTCIAHESYSSIGVRQRASPLI